MVFNDLVRSLRLRVLALLSLALLPIGLIAVYQTSKVTEVAAQNAQLALLALTEQAATEERLIVERAFGAAHLLSMLADELQAKPQDCAPRLSQFMSAEPSISYVAVIPASGIITCSSVERIVDVSDNQTFLNALQDPKPEVDVARDATVSGTSILLVRQPYYQDGVVAGFVSVSLPHNRMNMHQGLLSAEGLIDVITFNSKGDLLTSNHSLDDAPLLMPRGIDLTEVRVDRPRSFRGTDSAGNNRLYTIASIIGSPISIMGVWDTESEIVTGLKTVLPALMFPALMWAASLCVAMLALHTLVERPIYRLRHTMREFEDTRVLPEEPEAYAMPKELEDLSRSFHDMAASILHDEAEMEDLLRDKSVLVKEVHHRVKNNLQMISSIMNMQINMAAQPETRQVLGRLQDRVLSLATIHQNLYQSQNSGQIDASPLVQEIVQKSIEMATREVRDVALTTDFDPLMLYPDQAVPLSLLASEAITNALKYLGAASGAKPTIDTRLKRNGREVTFTLRNAMGPVTGASFGTGMGAQLMKGFVIQLGGKMEVTQTDAFYELVVRFNIADFAPEPFDF